MKKLSLFMMILITSGMETSIAMSVGNTDEILSKEGNGTESYSHITTDDSVRLMVNHPAFKGFGRYLLPRDNATSDYDRPLNQVGSLMPYHEHVDPNIVVGTINHMIDEINNGNKIFYDFYAEHQNREDPSKASTGLFFFRGQPGAPFAIVCPGGGFAYVGSLQEGFPLAMVLSQKGYNTFVLRYRTGGGLRATEDLSAAISYVFKNADRLGVSVADYSLWGGSAGARMVGNIALHGTAGFGDDDLQKPRIVVIAYTGHAIFSEHFPPTFIMVSVDDGIVHVPTVDKRVENMRNAGIEVEYHKYSNAGHGFGLGTGTDAEGWIEHATQFWEKYLSE